MPHSISWDRNLTGIFIELCTREVDRGNRPTTFFNKDGWTNISNGFKDRTGMQPTQKQMKNKWDNMKKEWKLWKELLQGSTGIGWNTLLRTVDAPEEWWEEKISSKPDVKKFRNGGIDPEMEEKLDYLFSAIVATGQHAWAPSMDPSYFSRSSINKSTGDELGGSEDDMAVEEGGFQGTRPHKKHRKSASAKGLLEDTCKEIVRTVQGACGGSSMGESSTWHRVMSFLTNEPGVREDVDFYYFALRYLDKNSRREMFIAMPPEDRIGFLRDAYCREK